MGVYVKIRQDSEIFLLSEDEDLVFRKLYNNCGEAGNERWVAKIIKILEKISKWNGGEK